MSADLDTRVLKRALAQAVTSVVVVTTSLDGVAYGFTASSFTTVSFDPPIVVVSLAETAECHEAFLRAENVAINLLADHQSSHAQLFATRGADKFGAVASAPGVLGVPVLDEVALVLEGHVHERHSVGDHLMLLIRVEHLASAPLVPLAYQARQFRKLV